MKENWRIIHDGTLSSIERTDDEVDHYDVFPTFSKAKKAMIQSFQETIREYKHAVQKARQLKKSEIKHRREIYE